MKNVTKIAKKSAGLSQKCSICPLMQRCDAIKNEGDVLYYITVYRTDDNQYLYLGVLPEFKQIRK